MDASTCFSSQDTNNWDHYSKYLLLCVEASFSQYALLESIDETLLKPSCTRWALNACKTLRKQGRQGSL